MKNVAIIFCLLLLPTGLLAQENNTEEEKEKPVKVAQAKTEQNSETSNADDYKASEEISEDLSVSYPVDI